MARNSDGLYCPLRRLENEIRAIGKRLAAARHGPDSASRRYPPFLPLPGKELHSDDYRFPSDWEHKHYSGWGRSSPSWYDNNAERQKQWWSHQRTSVRQQRLYVEIVSETIRSYLKRIKQERKALEAHKVAYDALQALPRAGEKCNRCSHPYREYFDRLCSNSRRKKGNHKKYNPPKRFCLDSISAKTLTPPLEDNCPQERVGSGRPEWWAPTRRRFWNTPNNNWKLHRKTKWRAEKTSFRLVSEYE